MKYKCYGKTFWVGVVWQKFRLGVVSGLSSFHIFVYPGRSLVAHAPTRTPPAVYSLPRTLSPGHCPYRYSSAPHSQNTSPRGHRTAEPSDGLRSHGTQSRLPSHRKKSWYRVATEFRACNATDTDVVLKGNKRIAVLHDYGLGGL